MSNSLVAFLSFVLLLLSFQTAIKFATAQRTKDVVETLIDEAGFQSEVHGAETEDGYIIKVHRILKKSSLPGRGSAFFLHGITETSAAFIRTGPGKSLPYILSELGYDVWLGNTRGNDHGLSHKTLSVDSREFWDFSFHEIGFYDLPAMFDLMLKVTNTSRGFYFGHSQGGSSFAVMTSMRPEYNTKVIQAHLLAPAIFMENFPHPLAGLATLLFEELAKTGSYELRNKYFVNQTNRLSELFCLKNFDDKFDFARGICSSAMAQICGFNKREEQLDRGILPNFLKYFTHSVSLKQFLHFFQLHKSGSFSKFDYGQKNQKLYGSPTAPDYPIKNIVAPVFIYAGSCDALVSEIDLKHLSEALPNVKKYKVFDNYNHCDFTFGKHSKRILFDGILRSMKKQQH